MHLTKIAHDQKRDEVFLWRNGHAELGIRLRSVSADQRWNGTRGRRHVGTWIGLFYEDMVEQILGRDENIATAQKVTTVSRISERALEITKPSPPDLFTETTTGSVAFLEVKSSAPESGWPVIYRDQLDTYEEYVRMWIPTFFVFIGHPIEQSQDRFRKSPQERRTLAVELKTPQYLHILPASIVRDVYLSATSQEINDKRMYNRLFKRIRARRIAEASTQYLESFPVEYLNIKTSLLTGFALQS